ncbi:MAG: RIFT barrel domain-containing protein, partial [Planctomycetota bacterium]
MRSLVKTVLVLGAAWAVLGAVARAGESAGAEAGTVKWTVKKTGGSGFIDSLSLDGKEVVADSKGRPRVIARLAVPPAGALPIGARVNWKQLPASLEIQNVTASGGNATEVTGRLVYPQGAAEGTFTVKLRASGDPGVLLSDLELSWGKLPVGAQLAEAGLEMATVFEPKDVLAFMRPDAPGKWDYRMASGFGVSPVDVGSYIPGPTGGTAVRYLSWLQTGKTEGSRIFWCSRSGKSFRLPDAYTVEWCDLSDSDRGVAVIARGVSAAAPKMFGSSSRSDRSLFFWAWPPTVDGLAVKTGEKYTCANVAWHFHRGRACRLKRAKHKSRYYHGTEKGGIEPEIAALRKKLPAVAGNMAFGRGEKTAALPGPDLAWLEAEKDGALPPAAPKPEGKLIPILVAGGGAAPAGEVPFRCGVPFPKGKLKDAVSLRLLSAAGEEIPCQVEKTASWPDGSVKWVLVDFLAAAPGGKGRVAARLEWGAGVSRKAAPKRAVKVVEGGEGVSVDTGRIRFVAGMGKCGLFRTLEFDVDG